LRGSNWQIVAVRDKHRSDLSQVFEVDDIFTGKNAISGLNSNPWAGLGKTGQYSLESSFFGI
jgi:hypothetical protein